MPASTSCGSVLGAGSRRHRSRHLRHRPGRGRAGARHAPRGSGAGAGDRADHAVAGALAADGRARGGDLPRRRGYPRTGARAGDRRQQAAPASTRPRQEEGTGQEEAAGSRGPRSRRPPAGTASRPTGRSRSCSRRPWRSSTRCTASIPAPRRRWRRCGSGGSSTPRSASTSAASTTPAPSATCRPPGSSRRRRMGWGMLPTYVGPQAPCWSWYGPGVRITPSQAAAEGVTAGEDARRDARLFGLPAGSPHLLRHGGLRQQPELRERGADVHQRLGPHGGRGAAT